MAAWLAALLEKVLILLTQDLISWVAGQWAKLRRTQAQKAAAEKVAQDQGKPRNDQTKQDESNDINS